MILDFQRDIMMKVVLAVVFLSLVWLLQRYLVFPLEQALRPENSNVRAFSFVFLPHGAKVLIAMFFNGLEFASHSGCVIRRRVNV